MRSKTVQPMLGKPNSTPRAMSVNATGNPIKMAKIMMHIMMMPRTGSLTILGLLLNVFEALRPVTGLERGDAPENLGHALHGDQKAGDRNHHLERPDDRPLRRGDRALTEAVGHLREVVAGPDQRDDAGVKKDEPE